MKKRLRQASIGKIQCEIDLHTQIQPYTYTRIRTHGIAWIVHRRTHGFERPMKHTCIQHTHTHKHIHHTQYPPTPAKRSESLKTPISTNTWHIFSFIPTHCGGQCLALNLVQCLSLLLQSAVTYGPNICIACTSAWNQHHRFGTHAVSFVRLRLLQHLSITDEYWTQRISIRIRIYIRVWRLSIAPYFLWHTNCFGTSKED